jgi:signal transduction histidine kinase
MSQSSSADAARGALPAQRGAGSALALRNWRVTCSLILLVAIPTVLGLAVTGLRVSEATRSAAAYGHVARLAALGQEVTALAQAMEEERASTAAFIADGRPAAGLMALHRQYAITDGWASTVRRQVLQLGPGYPAQTRASAAAVLASIGDLPGLRRHAAQQQTSALAVINGYSAATASLFPVNDGIADLSGNSALITSVRALGALSRMKDQASLQQAILGTALAEGHFGPGSLTALDIAHAQQAGDLASFRSSATPEEIWAFTDTLAGPLPGQARAVEQRATAAGNGALALGAHAGQQWSAGMSYTVSWMRHSEQQLAGWISAYAQSLQRNATRDAIITGGAALAALALVVLATMIIARSIVRPLRRLQAAALDIAGARLPAEVRALGAAANSGRPLPVTPIDVLSPNEIGQVARAFDQVHESAVRLAGEEARLRGSDSAIFGGFFRRSHSLLERLLGLIDNLELREDDPERLATLFQVDHLATRMRRNSESALVLVGHETPRRRSEPVTLVDVLRAAVSETEQYGRVILNVQPGISVSGSAVADAVHLVAELLENATTFSPKATQVIVSGHAVRGGGALISITDHGTGIPEEHRRQLNGQLAHPPLADMEVARHMGLFAVAHLAARHGVEVALVLPPGGGTTAEVHLPAALIDVGPEAAGGPLVAAGPGAVAEPGAAAEPDVAVPGAVPMPLGAPLPSPAPAPSLAVTMPEPADAEPGGVLPIFESVESGYFRTRGGALLGPGEAEAGQPAPGGQPADTPAVGGLTSAGLPQRIPKARPVPRAAVDRETRQATAAESVQIARGRLASFQRGSQRARAEVRMDRYAKQQVQDD